MKTEKRHIDRCDKCGATTTDLDAGFCPSLHRMKCSCGGRWRKTDPLAAAATDQQINRMSKKGGA